MVQASWCPRRWAGTARGSAGKAPKRARSGTLRVGAFRRARGAIEFLVEHDLGLVKGRASLPLLERHGLSTVLHRLREPVHDRVGRHPLLAPLDHVDHPVARLLARFPRVGHVVVVQLARAGLDERRVQECVVGLDLELVGLRGRACVRPDFALERTGVGDADATTDLLVDGSGFADGTLLRDPGQGLGRCADVAKLIDLLGELRPGHSGRVQRRALMWSVALVPRLP